MISTHLFMQLKNSNANLSRTGNSDTKSFISNSACAWICAWIWFCMSNSSSTPTPTPTPTHLITTSSGSIIPLDENSLWNFFSNFSYCSLNSSGILFITKSGNNCLILSDLTSKIFNSSKLGFRVQLNILLPKSPHSNTNNNNKFI